MLVGDGGATVIFLNDAGDPAIYKFSWTGWYSRDACVTFKLLACKKK